MEAQGESRIFENRGDSPSPKKSPLRKKPRVVDVLTSNVCKRLTFCEEEKEKEEKTVIPRSLCETNEERCVRYMGMCRQRGITKEEECERAKFYNHKTIVNDFEWVKADSMKWRLSKTHKRECPLNCKSDEELSYFDLLPNEVIDKISSLEEIAIANMRLDRGFNKCHEEMDRLPRCDEHGTVRVEKYLFKMLDAGFNVFQEYLYGTKIKGTHFQRRSFFLTKKKKKKKFRYWLK